MNINKSKANSWQFSEIPNIEEANFDKVLERFYKMRISGLVRENIQNSLDGKISKLQEPVIVRINTGDLLASEVPGIDEIKERISNLKGQSDYNRKTISYMQKQIKDDNTRYISFEDENTRGLSGAENGQSTDSKHTWSAYAYNKGVHAEIKESDLEKVRGGSHGVGKIASNAASDIHVTFFANCDELGKKHLGGTVQLIEHEYQNKYYRSTGYFAKKELLNDKKTKFYPFANNFSEIFQKNTRGLKIIIPYLRSEYDNENEIIKSVIEGFFVGIIQKKLIVFVNNQEISSETIMNFIEDPILYEQVVKECKTEFTPLYVKTYKKALPKKIMISNGVEDYEFDLYFEYNPEIPKGRVAIVRTVGMKIQDFTVSNHSRKPFNAVLIGSLNEDSYLKSLENESHTALSSEHIKDKEMAKRAKKFISNMSNVISKIIQTAFEEQNPTDGILNTGDVLYQQENNFKNELEKSTGSVLVNQGKKLIKSSTTKSNKNEGRGKQDNSKTSDQPQSPIKKKERKIRPPRIVGIEKTSSDADHFDSDEKELKKYAIYSEAVDRVILGDKEILELKINNIMNKSEFCNLELSVIDGMGNEQENEFILNNNYKSVIDVRTNTNCTIVDQQIQGVSIEDGVIKIELLLAENNNRSLKFIYYVEV